MSDDGGVVRPDAPSTGYGQLCLAPDGRIVAVRSGNAAYMAFDPMTGKLWAGDAIHELSPFITLDAQAKASQDDVALVRVAIRDAFAHGANQDRSLIAAIESGTFSGVPSPSVLKQALEHPNPAIRVLSRELLSELEERIREAKRASGDTSSEPQKP